MDQNTIIIYLISGTLLGIFGQGIRVIVGIKKQLDIASVTGATRDQWMDRGRIAISLAIGAIAGFLGAVLLWELKFDREFLITMLGVGYSGTDFIEGFMKTELPATRRAIDNHRGQPTTPENP